MMTDAMHDLPFVVSKTCSAEVIFEDVIFMMNEIMTNSCHAN